MRRLISFTVLSTVKILSHVFFSLEKSWIKGPGAHVYRDVKLIVFLNHTSLFEPVFIMALPWHFIWKLSARLVAPGADKTLNRPLVGWFYRNLSPHIVSITRKKDHSWDKFLATIESDSVILILPEGRMKRKNGLDSEGKPMTIRGGVADIIDSLKEGEIVFAYSGGLHHVQFPGQKFPKLFKKLKINLEHVDIQEYKKNLKAREEGKFKLQVIKDLEERMSRNIPS